MGDVVVKTEVNGIKRGIIGDTTDLPLCAKARKAFNLACKARIVSFSQLYGGKIAAALSRQHPRDLFDCALMDLQSFDTVKDGFILCLLGSDNPIAESLHPNEIDQHQASRNQFEGMSDVPFSYEDYIKAKTDLLKLVNDNLTDDDKSFLLSFEEGAPDWSKCCTGDLSAYPAVRWKLFNIEKLKKSNPTKHEQEVKKLRSFLSLSTTQP